jgi:hypothetical protein
MCWSRIGSNPACCRGSVRSPSIFVRAYLVPKNDGYGSIKLLHLSLHILVIKKRRLDHGRAIARLMVGDQIWTDLG